MIIEVVPMVIVLLSILYFGFRIKQFSRGFQGGLGMNPRRMLIYPLGLLVIWTTNLTYVLLCLFYEDIRWLDFIRITLTRLSGFLHSMVYIAQSVRLLQIEERRQSQFVQDKSSDPSLELSNYSDTGCSRE